MTDSPKPTCHSLVISGSHANTEIWLGDDAGHFVQKAVGELRSRLMPGDYVIEFGLGAPTYPIRLRAPGKYTQSQLEAGPTCPRPVPVFDGTGPCSVERYE